MEARNLSEIKHFQIKIMKCIKREKEENNQGKNLSRWDKNCRLYDDAKICNFYNPENRSKHDKTAMKVSRLNRK